MTLKYDDMTADIFRILFDVRFTEYISVLWFGLYVYPIFFVAQ